MAPLIDIVFQLLIFFMLTSAFTTPSIKLNLPKAVVSDQKELEKIVVSIDKTADIFLNQEKVPLPELKFRLETKLKTDAKKSIYLRGDEDMPYRLFVQVMDLARQAGARQINIAHEKGEKQ